MRTLKEIEKDLRDLGTFIVLAEENGTNTPEFVTWMNSRMKAMNEEIAAYEETQAQCIAALEQEIATIKAQTAAVKLDALLRKYR